jgi:hypothetical protein
MGLIKVWKACRTQRRAVNYPRWVQERPEFCWLGLVGVSQRREERKDILAQGTAGGIAGQLDP